MQLTLNRKSVDDAFRKELKQLTVLLTLLFCASVLPVLSQTDNSQELVGIVVDSAGNPISGAFIEIASSQPAVACKTNLSGNFKCKLQSAKKYEITVRANGFLSLRQTIANIQDFSEILTFKLSPIPIREEVAVSILKTPVSLAETPASVDILEREEISRNASASTDDVLRQSVGFGLFRRSGSQTSNPTTQGASLRGINSSGASRSQVLFDSVPINDPFGGWIIWGRVPKISLERIEVLRGGSSAFFGSGSVGGTIGLIPRESTKDGPEFSAEVSAGNSKTFDGSFYGGFKKALWQIDGFAGTFQTRGYKIIEQDARGAVDDFANSRNTNLSIRVARELAQSSQFFVRGSVFGEGRGNGTPTQKNRTHIRDFAAGLDLNFGVFDNSLRTTRLVARVFGGSQVFDQTFSAISGDRSSESLARFQRVPAQRTGFSSNLISSIKDHTLVFGFEGSETRGSSNETGFFAGAPTSKIGSGGRERKYALFFQDFAKFGERLFVSGAVRFDYWKNYRALSSLKSLSSNVVTTEVFSDRSENALSPNISVLYQFNDSFSGYALTGRSFRSPTLNELYRGFRVGSVITNPNALLRAEKAWNTEAGVRYSKGRTAFTANIFRTSVSNAISNVTFNPGPPLILRERRNAGETVTSGFETEAEFRQERFDVSAGFLWTDSKVVRFDSDPGLVGRRIPQSPRLQFTFQTTIRPSDGWTIALQGRASSKQFDDDANTFELEPYFKADLFVSKRVKDQFAVFMAIENLFNSRYSIGKTPIRTIGSPIGVRIGVRWN